MKQTRESLPVVKREQCPKCKDTGKDNVAVYSDGSKWCFSCDAFVKTSKAGMIEGNIQSLSARGITEEVCRFFDYQIGQFTGKIAGQYVKDRQVHIANYYSLLNHKIAQKIRDRDKNMLVLGQGNGLPLYGSWKYAPTEKLFITVVEGEIDALTVAQVQGLQYPVVSVPLGAAGAYKALSENLEWLSKFKHVVLAFDNDDAGRRATEACIPLFEFGKVRIAHWPLKDANEMLLAGRGNEITHILFNSQPIIPTQIVSISDIIDQVLIKPEYGIAYPWRSMTEITYGFQLGELHIVVGANGIGKTEFIKDLMFHFLEKNVSIGLFSFEQNPDSTVRRIVGARLGHKLHLPGAEWNEDNIRSEAMRLDNKLYLYDKIGFADYIQIFNAIKYLSRVKGVKLFIIDNLKGLKILEDREKAVELMTTLQALKKELGVTIILLSHVAKDKYNYQAYVSTSPKNPTSYANQTVEDIEGLIKRPGMEWESGRMPTKENVEGPSIVCDLADYVWGLARNTTSEDLQESRTTRVKVLKSRLDSAFTGKIFKLYYTDEGKLEELGGINGI